MDYAVEVSTDSSGEFCGNGLKFPTVEAAEAYAKDLWSRWTAVKEWRVVQTVHAGWGHIRVPVEKLVS
jgi:ABC-type Fe3+-hydroxamate transport system substrate-binding protein